MLSGSPVIIDSFYRTEAHGVAKRHQLQTNYDPFPTRYKQISQNRTQIEKSYQPSPSAAAPSEASNFKTTAMSAFNSDQRDAEYPIINVEAENEHFDVSDSIISWIEHFKTLSNIPDNDKLELSSTEFSPESLYKILPPPSSHHQLSAPGMAWNMVKIFSDRQQSSKNHQHLSTTKILSDLIQPVQEPDRSPSPTTVVKKSEGISREHSSCQIASSDEDPNSNVRMRGNDEWAPPRPQIIFNIHEEANFRKSMQRQNYRCSGCGTKIDLKLARRSVLYCHYLGKYFCKCCFSHKSINLPGYILQKWDFHKYPVSHFALQLLDRIANEPLFNINDINTSLYRKVKKLRHLIDIRMQLYYLKIYISTCTQTDKLNGEYTSFTHQHLLQDDVHLYSLNNLIEIQHGKLYEYLNDLVTRSISHIAQCDRCRAKGHYCQLCGPSSLVSSAILNTNEQVNRDSQTRLRCSNSVSQNIHSVASSNQSAKASDSSSRQQGNHSRSSSGNYSIFTLSTNLSSSSMTPGGQACAVTNVNVNDHELIFPFEIGRVAQCQACGCCFHLQCFLDAGQNCPKCERIQRRKAETSDLCLSQNSSVTNVEIVPTCAAQTEP